MKRATPSSARGSAVTPSSNIETGIAVLPRSRRRQARHCKLAPDDGLRSCRKVLSNYRALLRRGQRSALRSGSPRIRRGANAPTLKARSRGSRRKVESRRRFVRLRTMASAGTGAGIPIHCLPTSSAQATGRSLLPLIAASREHGRFFSEKPPFARVGA
jgi:hypothetical protein